MKSLTIYHLVEKMTTDWLLGALIKGNLAFENVSFSYEENNLILDNISLCLKAGDSLAIMSNSGGGKSTLVNLIPRYLCSSEGEIKIDDININEFKLNSLRKI